ncbi:MAG: phytanoyl-CoA dioxygenase family protein [Planctomycetota bacterium]|nr:phytanoyl-CoA dioxygenase family protein [Planctomycetota bacterium]MDA1139164.1 phytanoyl-CoA dioxygenase family protein [Planctomycetota bacterium]
MSENQTCKTRFESDGYLIVEGILNDDELTACRKEIRRLHECFAEWEANGDPRARSFQREPYAKEESNDGLPVLRKIEGTLEVSSLFKDLAAHPKLVEILTELIGPDILQFRSTLMLKPAFHGSVHGFHQDSAYWPMEPPTLVTLSIALTDSTSENGCFRIIPESHKWGLQEWGRIARDQDEPLTDRKDIDTSNYQEVPLKAGSALFFHSLLVHGSGPNTTPNPRNTALYAYFPPSVHLKPLAEGKPYTRTFRVINGLSGEESLVMESS